MLNNVVVYAVDIKKARLEGTPKITKIMKRIKFASASFAVVFASVASVVVRSVDFAWLRADKYVNKLMTKPAMSTPVKMKTNKYVVLYAICLS